MLNIAAVDPPWVSIDNTSEAKAAARWLEQARLAQLSLANAKHHLFVASVLFELELTEDMAELEATLGDLRATLAVHIQRVARALSDWQMVNT